MGRVDRGRAGGCYPRSRERCAEIVREFGLTGTAPKSRPAGGTYLLWLAQNSGQSHLRGEELLGGVILSKSDTPVARLMAGASAHGSR
jgi:hypothetical protein